MAYMLYMVGKRKTEVQTEIARGRERIVGREAIDFFCPQATKAPQEGEGGRWCVAQKRTM